MLWGIPSHWCFIELQHKNCFRREAGNDLTTKKGTFCRAFVHLLFRPPLSHYFYWPIEADNKLQLTYFLSAATVKRQRKPGNLLRDISMLSLCHSLSLMSIVTVHKSFPLSKVGFDGSIYFPIWQESIYQTLAPIFCLLKQKAYFGEDKAKVDKNQSWKLTKILPGSSHIAPDSVGIRSPTC